ncbi:transcriptional regulator [Halalkalibacter wakoensis JCM 9140]|uniref:Transcriptional regulator n=1 Tax=Halalkalibacter wakoensis JCM 9140 TaxID=1236970 RepID=W4PXR4_9BACI|nr:MarR family transcriptional regulator [Halalkalibacter wakoensis]GAE24522.1 transcriptional regulator [Halalkalibacter wakoensis JCM 9140]
MAENETLGKQEVRLGLLLWFRLARFYNESNRKSNQHVKSWGLTIAQFDLLAQIGVHQPISQQELAEKLFVSKGNITQMLVKLEKLELVERKQEWRVKRITLTPKGEQLFQDVVPKQERFQAAQFAKLDYHEQKQLLSLLKKLDQVSE